MYLLFACFRTVFTIQCHDVHTTLSDKCDFIMLTEDCRTESFIDYAEFIYCGFADKNVSVGLGICVSVYYHLKISS